MEDSRLGPQPLARTLSPRERADRECVARRHTTPQHHALRARLIVRAADGLNTAQVARLHAVSVDTARHWRVRWRGLHAASRDDISMTERLADAPRSGTPGRSTAEQVCQSIERAGAAPAQTGRPISYWTARELAVEIKQRGSVEQMSDRHAARVAQRGPPTAPVALLADPG